ncbi:hypothetical protein A2154_00640 [Candidatus Gottesmanbacteria bacterium RBG_16_43_7]|uniref:Polymerase nucleotidyl transferase domain-containing protein n=1 Tax=Candidatus Gottesmanbacteria bacterium RBG_16_43_7 TaxID=1798373 RepID=A0A1F5Z805_9BACT|nr:MAG: hypothetical protein A2154_00640 [Candidatus Gottesmanbacteria bacterium RBG_16_43_7]
MLTLRESVLTTIAYADVFDYPLTAREVHLWLIYRSADVSRIIKELQAITDGGGDGLYVLSGRKLLAKKRAINRRTADHKWRVARQAVGWIRRIPTISLIGVTGGLAMNNASAADDIDLFFIVRDHTLWISRFLITLTVEICGRRRHPDQKNISDAICLNMFMTESALEVIDNQQDLYGAHEVLQMIPLWERGDIYRRFLDANKWVRHFLPNAWSNKQAAVQRVQYSSRPTIFMDWSIIIKLCSLLERYARASQIWYMQKRRTREVVTLNLIQFHPQDARRNLRRKLLKRLKQFKIPLDKVFPGCIK